MGLHLVDLYRSPNIGIFLKANDKVILVPKGIASSKAEKLATDMDVSACHTSVGGTRLLGPLIAMNNKGVVASRMIEDYEMEEISSKTGLKVTRLESRFTAVGNLVAANDHGADCLASAGAPRGEAGPRHSGHRDSYDDHRRVRAGGGDDRGDQQRRCGVPEGQRTGSRGESRRSSRSKSRPRR